MIVGFVVFLLVVTIGGAALLIKYTGEWPPWDERHPPTINTTVKAFTELPFVNLPGAIHKQVSKKEDEE